MGENNPFDPLPCPFCGHIGVSILEGSTFRWRLAECGACGARAGEVRHNTTDPDQTTQEVASGRRALDAWNTRTSRLANPKADTSTTRDGFLEWWKNAARQCDYGRVLLPTHHEAYTAGQQAKKAEELAFLENLVEHVDSFIWKRIDERIAELKGESRG